LDTFGISEISDHRIYDEVSEEVRSNKWGNPYANHLAVGEPGFEGKVFKAQRLMRPQVVLKTQNHSTNG
jgi:hypothetical protein